MQTLPHQFLTFCRSKPADEAYDYVGWCAPCALHQFLIATGYPVETVGPRTWSDRGLNSHKIDPLVADALVACNFTMPNDGRTFGALADRLEAALTKAKVA